jgi:hypothetical protein
MSPLNKQRDNSSTERNQLRNLLQNNAKDLQNEVLSSGGAVPAEKLEALRRLSDLVGICDNAERNPPRSRWPLIAVFGCTLLIVSILLFTGPGSTEIEMNLRLDQVGFVLPVRQVLSEQLSRASLGVTGVSQVELPRAERSEARTLVSGRDFDSSVALTVTGERPLLGEVALPDLILPAQTKVSFRKSEGPNHFRLTIPTAGLNLSAAVNGPVNVSPIAGGQAQLNFRSPKSVIFTSQSQEVNLDLTFRVLPQKISPMPLTVQDLNLLRIEDRRGIEGLPVRRVSTILSGTIIFEELNGKKVSLRPGEVIEMESSKGEIVSLEFKDDIAVQFHGRVRGITSGPADIHQNLMPTWLEWLKARQGLSLFWGSAIYLFGLVVAIRRWLRAPE